MEVSANAKLLEPVRQSRAEGRPIRWNRVNALPHYVFFDHSAHLAKGVGCTTCHGPVDRMPLAWKVGSLRMGWCLDCHRDPAPNLRPREEVFNPDLTRTPDTPSGDQLLTRCSIHPKTLSDCSVGHR